MSESVVASGWPEWVAVKSSDLNVTRVEHEVVEWVAAFTSEDAIPLPPMTTVDGDGVVWRVEKVTDKNGSTQPIAYRHNCWVMGSSSDCWMDGQSAYRLVPVEKGAT